MMEMNEVLEKLPPHLMDFIIDQPYNTYTAQDHAVWRYIMRQNVNYLTQVAHESYLEGLKAAGISIDSIPHMYGMNRILKKIGWAAVAVDGFIPPSAFMEFQAYNVLVIAADIRPIDQVEYTPAPDIVHEAAGHAPIIANREYSEYLRFFGELGSKAFSSAKDYELYEAIRHLSIFKADPYTPAEAISAAERHLAEVEKQLGEPSEMAKIRNLHWWTVEYGLIGDLKKPKIYGAGLLSSIGESFNCLKDSVRKLPYTIDAVNYSFDITSQQPQLFVTPDFENLNYVLNQYADTMALRRGGLYGISTAIESGNTATCVLSSGLQISGTFSEIIEKSGDPVFFRTAGPTQLSIEDSQIVGHGKDYHNKGYSSPIGKLNNSSKPIELLSDSELDEINISIGKVARLEFASGIIVQGIPERYIRHNGHLLIITFSDCTVEYNSEILFRPEWGTFDMAVGETIVSAYSGPADPNAWELRYAAPSEKTHKIHHSDYSLRLHSLYQGVRDVRDSEFDITKLRMIWEDIRNNYPNDWLLPLEILEMLTSSGREEGLQEEIQKFLENLKEKGYRKLINDGLQLLN